MNKYDFVCWRFAKHKIIHLTGVSVINYILSTFLVNALLKDSG